MLMQPFRRGVVALFLCLLATAHCLAAQPAVKQYVVHAPDGVALAVEESGNPAGQPLIFIHGLLGSRLNWLKQTRDPQFQHYRLISYDLRGHGLSGKPAQPDAYTDGRRWAADLEAVISATHVDGAILVGWSLGGVVISNYLATYGDRKLKGAVYVDGVVELNAQQIVPHPDIYRAMVDDDLKTHLDGMREFLALCFEQRPDPETFGLLLQNAALASWDMQKAVQSMHVFAATGLARTRIDLLFVYGGKDALVNPGATIARARQLNPAIESLIYPASGHAPFIEESQRFNRDLLAFISRLGNGKRDPAR